MGSVVVTSAYSPPCIPGKASGHHCLHYVLPWLLFLSSDACAAFELEAFQTHPGTRAMGMAGVFVAQADDSSAIWYNPAGAKSDAATKADISVEFANVPGVNNEGEYSRSGAELKFLGGYTEERFAIFGAANPVAIGAGYFLPYRTTIYIDALRPAIDNPLPYGYVDVTHRQVSALVAAAPMPGFSWGATLDAMWSEINCRDYDLCVKKSGPTGYGASLGAKYSVAKFSSGDVSIAAAWRSRIALHYAARPATGLGSVIEDYLPGRPASIALGINLRTSMPFAIVNINAQAERIGWSDTTKDTSIADYEKLGASAEALFPMHNDSTFALRLGVSRASTSGAASGVRIIAAGFGYSFARHHSIDIAWERRALGAETRESFASLSYSIQR